MCHIHPPPRPTTCPIFTTASPGCIKSQPEHPPRPASSDSHRRISSRPHVSRRLAPTFSVAAERFVGRLIERGHRVLRLPLIVATTIGSRQSALGAREEEQHSRSQCCRLADYRGTLAVQVATPRSGLHRGSATARCRSRHHGNKDRPSFAERVLRILVTHRNRSSIDALSFDTFGNLLLYNYGLASDPYVCDS